MTFTSDASTVNHIDGGGGMLRRQAPDVAPTLLSSGLVQYLLSTSALARDGFEVLTRGWYLDNFRKNPQFLFAHKADEFPIGRVENIEIVGDELRGSVKFAAHPEAQLARQLVIDGFMPAASVGFLPLEWDRSQPNVILRAELLECSAVPVGSLPSALARQALARGVDMHRLGQLANRALEQPQLDDVREMAMMVRSAAASVSAGAAHMDAVAGDLAIEARLMQARKKREEYLSERHRREMAAARREEFLRGAA